MANYADFTADLFAPDGKVRVSDYLAHTRGVAFDVRTEDGRLVEPLEPPPPSSPVPPAPDNALQPLFESKPFSKHVGDPTRNIFPGPGRYQVRIVVDVMNFGEATWTRPAGDPANYAEFISPPIWVTVTR